MSLKDWPEGMYIDTNGIEDFKPATDYSDLEPVHKRGLREMYERFGISIPESLKEETVSEADVANRQKIIDANNEWAKEMRAYIERCKNKK